MRTLPVLLVGSVLMVLTAAADAESGDVRPAESLLEKRSTGRWTRFGARCFRYISSVLTWSEAEVPKNCQALGGNLASVHSIQEYQNIQRVITAATRGNPLTWLGGYDSQQIKFWFWSDGTPFHFSHWCPGQPNNYGNYERCMQMNYGDGRCLDDLYCKYTRPSVCARKC